VIPNGPLKWSAHNGHDFQEITNSVLLVHQREGCNKDAYGKKRDTTTILPLSNQKTMKNNVDALTQTTAEMPILIILLMLTKNVRSSI
jgi:hypothetical protein